jgi:hypothetical protein
MTSPTDDGIVSVRYLVDGVAAAISFSTTHLGFTSIGTVLPAFADVRRSNLRLLLSGPGGRKIVLDDPAGNPVELFEPARA